MKEKWNEIADSLRDRIGAKHSARETALQTCRKVIQFSAKGIRHIHRGQYEEAKALIEETRTMVQNAQQLLEKHQDLYYAGWLQDAEKEYVEGEILYSIILKLPWKTPEELGVHHASYLNGVCEAASECRRYVLDVLRKGNPTEAERCMTVMEDCYDELITFDYPDALTGGLRRSCDALRAVLERTRSDFSVTSTQKELQAAVEKALDKLM